MVIRNTFLNAQPGQLANYGGAVNKRTLERVLKWIDLKAAGKKAEDDKPKTAREPLAKLFPIEDTMRFDRKISIHHNKTQRDITSCLRGTRLNKFQKQQLSANSKSGPLTSSVGAKKADAMTSGGTEDNTKDTQQPASS
jgi:hypothetical protein